jgi:hypothetical protein
MLTVNNQPMPKFLVAKSVAFLAKKISGADFQVLLQNYTQDQVDCSFLLAEALYNKGYNGFGSVYFSQVDLNVNK